MPETVGHHKNGCPKGKVQSDGPPSRRLLSILFCDKEDTGLVAPRHAGWIADFVLGWYPHATRRRKGKLGNWFSLDQILTAVGLSENQWRKAKPWLAGAVHIEHGGHAGKRSLFLRPTAQLQRFTAGKYCNKKAAKQALEALRQAPVATVHSGSGDPIQMVPTGSVTGHHQGHQGGQNPILSTLSPLSAQGDTKNQTFDLEKEKPAKIPQSVKVGPESKVTPPSPPAAGTVDLESLVELIYAAKLAQIEASYGLEPLPGSSLTEDDFDEAAKKSMLKKLKKDLQLYPSVPIPKGCKLVHPMCKDPIRWVSLSPKAKTDLYANKFLQYLENWKHGKAGKHAASIYGIDPKHFPVPKDMYDDDPEMAAEMAALDAELEKSMAGWDLDEAA